MAVQVCVGRAGTGKTALCLNVVRDRLREDAADGHHLIFLVPEQAAFQMERALIETPDLPGYSRCDVLSFRRLARRIFNETGTGDPAARQPMGPMGRLMAVKLLLKRLEPQLKILGGAGNRGAGFLTQVTRTLDEFLQEDLEPDELGNLAQAAATGETKDPLSAARLGDLHLLYSAYREFLTAGHLDPAQEVAVAEALIEKVPWVRDAEIWVDGFAGFTMLERRMLVRLAALARAMTITLLIDPASPVLSRADVRPNGFSLFSRTERTLSALREAMHSAGIEWLPVRRLTPSPPPRFGAQELVELERRVFAPPLHKGGRGGVECEKSLSPDSSPPTPPLLRGGGAVRLIAAASRRVEVDAAVAEIQRLIRESSGRLRYRDVAVIVRDLEPYHDLLSAALTAHGIPFFIDRRRRTAHHPLVELLRLLPALVHRSFQGDDIRLLLKTGLVPLDDVEADLLENYVIAHGIAGAEAWLGPGQWTYRRIFTNRDAEEELTEPERVALDQINRYRRRLVEPLREWVAFAVGGAAPIGREWAGQLSDVLDRLGAADRIERWLDAAIDAGRADEADVHGQVARDAKALLDDFVESLGDVPLTAEEFSGVLDSALAEFTLGLAPPTLDQVLVGSIERSRHPDLAAVLLLGFNDGLFPLTPAEDVILTDAERERLEQRRPPVGTTRRQRILDEKMLAYIALTRPSRTLWSSYPEADEAGKPLRPSPFVHDIRRALPALTLTRIEDPVPKRDLWPVGRLRELGARLALEFRLRPGSPEEDKESNLRARWNGLYEYARCQDPYAHDLPPILASLSYRNEAQLGPGDVEALYRAPTYFSASRIETFAACPFKHFAQYALGLEPRAEFVIEAIDFGLLHHKVLEEFYAELIHEGRALAEIEPDEIDERLSRLAKQWTARLTDEALLGDARNAFLLDRSNRHLREALARQRLMSRLGSFRPRAVEWAFGMPRGKDARTADIGPLELTTPGGRTILIRGKVDRIDLLELTDECLGVVLDYKRSKGRTLRLWKVYHGLDVQLLTYMLAIIQRGETLAGRSIRPVGAFYVPLESAQISVSHPDDAVGADESLPAPLKPRGVMDFGVVEHLDRELESGWSPAYGVFRSRNGELGYARNSDAYAKPELDRITAYARRKIGELADRILDGDVAVKPYRAGTRMPCTFCDFRPVCRFDHDVDEPDEIDAIEREEALDLMGRAEGGASR
jgi:ATP-dependent helicase/nuclease subunit B